MTSKRRKLLVVLGIATVVIGAGLLFALYPRGRSIQQEFACGDFGTGYVCSSAMYMTAHAITHYREARGEWPRSLSQLWPDFLDGAPRCPRDFVKYRASQQYHPPDGHDLPVLSCERHLKYRYYLYVPQWGDQSPAWPKHQWLYPADVWPRPSPDKARRAFRRCQAVLISLSRALRAYRNDTGHLPGRLEDLHPTYVSELPRCPRDAVEGRISYLYTLDGNEEVPLVTCERHWDHGYNLLIDRELHVRKDSKDKDVGPGRSPWSFDWKEDSILIE